MNHQREGTESGREPLDLAAVEEHYPRYHPFFLCAIRTVMRLGELLALQWGDIDLQGGFIEVKRAHVEGRLTTPKEWQDPAD